ncbi:MAG: S-layer homology domain-containing protein [Kineothrix sp.]
MKVKKRLFSMMLGAGVVLFGLQLPVAAKASLQEAAGQKTIYVGDNQGAQSGTYDRPYNDLADAVANADAGDTIVIKSGTVYCNDNGAGDPLVINEPLTIQGESMTDSVLYSRRNGFVLGADVTLKNFKLWYVGEINGIFANGHTLTIENMGWHTDKLVDLYAGGLADKGTAPGQHGQIRISGSSTKVGEIYGGSYGEAWTNASTITVNGNAEITGIKGCGKQDKFRTEKVTGDVTIYLTDSNVKTVDGMLDTDTQRKADLVFAATSFSNSTLALSNIGKLTVEQGTYIPPDLNEYVDVCIKKGAAFDISALVEGNKGTWMNTFTIRNLEGGGIVRMGADHALLIEGVITGTTSLQTTRNQPTDSSTSGIVNEGHAYFDTPLDTPKNAFTLTPHFSQPDMRLVKESGGNIAQWIAREEENGTEPGKANLQGAAVTVNGTFIYDGTAKIPGAAEVEVRLQGVTVDPSAYDISAENNIDAGTATVTVTAKAAGSYTGQAQGTFPISPRPVRVEAEAKEKFYGQADPELTYSVSGLLPEGGILNGALDKNGSSILQGTLTNANNPNYDISFTGAELTVKETTPNLEITLDNSVQTAGAVVQILQVTSENPYDTSLIDVPSPALTYQIGSGAIQPLTGNSFIIPAGTASGTVITIRASSPAAPGKYTAASASAQVTVTDKRVIDGQLSVSVSDLTYGSQPRPQAVFEGNADGSGSWTYTYSSGAGFRSLEELQDASGCLPAGSYMVKARYEDSTQVGEVTSSFEVLAAEIIITPAAGQGKAYGRKDPVSLQFTYGPAGGQAVAFTGSLGRAPGEDAGTYGYTLGSLSAGDNYRLILPASAPLFTISRAAAEVSVDSSLMTQQAGQPVTITVTAENMDSDVLTAGAFQPAAVAVKDAAGTAVDMEREGNGVFTGIYTIPEDKRPGDEISLRAVVEDSNYQKAEGGIVLTVGGAEEPSVKTIRLEPDSLTLGLGESRQLTAVLEPAGVQERIRWESSDPSVAEVDASGRVKAVDAGTAAVTATAGDVSVSCQIRVTFPFSDVSVARGGWKYESVKYTYVNGIMKGISGTDRFEPDAPLTRAMFATVLYRMAGEPLTAYGDRFTDVEEGKWYSNGIIWANSRGIVAGFDDGSYGINRNITREQIAKMLYEYARDCSYDISASAPLSSYTDLDQVSNWAKGYMEWSVGVGMISGKPNGNGSYRLDPKGEATRAECAAMLKRFQNKYQ